MNRDGAPIPSAALQAWSKSFLSGQDPEIRDALLSDSRVVTYSAGTVICRGNSDYRVTLVHKGRIRAKVTSWDGREVTTRYATAGHFTALPAMLTDGAPSSLEAVTMCEVSVLNPNTFRRLMRTRAELAYQVAVYLAESTYETVAYLEDNLFNSVQQRLSRHLLEMATPTVNGLLVQTDQTDLAHTIGSVREVVARALKKLDDIGAIRRYRRQIWIEDPALLRSFASTDLRGRRLPEVRDS
ncbi:Crp/Fnr family transcriptional regulator [Amycolatopsis thermoflava]|uniref:Crp/Fnr family transcriptional regulator n=1 Tax=Amycolatopsis thermoflava TaxID=84480 RepID=UPI003657CE24